MKLKRGLTAILAATMLLGTVGTAFAAEPDEKVTISEPDEQGVIYVYNNGGAKLGYHEDSGVGLLYDDGYAFKDLNQNGEIDPYEDWRLDTDTRARNLASIMVNDGDEGIAHIAGLMMYSTHQAVQSEEISNTPGSWGFKGSYDFLVEDNHRHLLVTSIKDVPTVAKWNNNVQALVESLGYGIPSNNSSDPRNSAGSSTVQYIVGDDGNISLWPNGIGLAATFDESIVEKFGQVASTEYRAMGIATALSPQIDLATEPRWSRVSGTFGEDSALSADLARAYIDGFQTTEGSETGWGNNSVHAMVKHWPSGGAEEGGRDAHYGYGKFAVYPGDNFDEHLIPFTEGAFKLNGPTGSASAVMPYYTISYDVDDKYNENVANGFSRYIISDLLRNEYEYDGVVCTDWMVTHDASADHTFEGKCWGVEDLTIAGRHYKAIMAGVDQFGGNELVADVLDAYDIMVATNGKSFANNRFEQSARRLLTNTINAGLFENPYLDAEESDEIVGNAEFMEAGYDAQLKSVVMIKNNNDIIAENNLQGKNVYVADFNASGSMTDANKTFYQGYLGDNFVENADDADVAVVVMSAPSTGSGYNVSDRNNGGNGYVPISLQYGPYTAATAREQSIAASPEVSFDGVENRSYKDKTVSASNAYFLNYLEQTKEAMGDKPVIVYMKASNPVVFSEVEPLADAIVVGYSIQIQAAMDIITGKVEPRGLLPLQQPVDMLTVEGQLEDVPHDMDCYIDSNNNVYDFGFGLNWNGQIKDARTAKYVDSLNQNTETIQGIDLLERFIKLADEIVADGGLENVFEGVVEEFYAAYAEAKSVLANAKSNNPTVTSDDVKAAYNRLWNVIQHLEFKTGDKTSLGTLNEIAEDILDNSDDYIPSTIAGLPAAVEAAKAVYDDVHAFDEDIAKAVDELFNVLTKSRLKPSKEKLEELLAQAQAIDTTEITEESALRLQNAVAFGLTVFNDEEATEDDVDDAVKLLTTALDVTYLSNTSGSGSSDDNTSSTDAGSGSGNSSSDGSTAAKGKTNGSPKTGDMSPVFLVLILTIAVGLLTIAKRRKN